MFGMHSQSAPSVWVVQNDSESLIGFAPIAPGSMPNAVPELADNAGRFGARAEKANIWSTKPTINLDAPRVLLEQQVVVIEAMRRAISRLQSATRLPDCSGRCVHNRDGRTPRPRETPHRCDARA